MKRIQRILFASDFSPASSRAFKTAVDLALALKSGLLVMHTLTSIAPLEGQYAPYVDWVGIEKASRDAAQKELDRLARRARRGGVRASTLLNRGYPSEQIARAARSRRVQLIVMGTHGRSGLSRLVMGSVAARVMIGAPCPVVTVRAR